MRKSSPAWPDLLANAIEKNLLAFKQGRLNEIDFVDDMSVHDPQLNDPRNLAGKNLSAAWEFADQFFDAAILGDHEVGGIEMSMAFSLLEEVVQRLRDRAEIVDPLVLQFRRR